MSSDWAGNHSRLDLLIMNKNEKSWLVMTFTINHSP